MILLFLTSKVPLFTERVYTPFSNAENLAAWASINSETPCNLSTPACKEATSGAWALKI